MLKLLSRSTVGLTRVRPGTRVSPGGIPKDRIARATRGLSCLAPLFTCTQVTGSRLPVSCHRSVPASSALTLLDPSLTVWSPAAACGTLDSHLQRHTTNFMCLLYSCLEKSNIMQRLATQIYRSLLHGGWNHYYKTKRLKTLIFFPFIFYFKSVNPSINYCYCDVGKICPLWPSTIA